MSWEGLDVSILGPACLAGLIVLTTHVPLGMRVLARGIIFIDLAIAQIAALGVILAQFFGMDEHAFVVQIAAAIAALLGASLLSATDKRWPEYQEPLIGTAFVLAASGALLLLANNPHGGEHLKNLLVGQILWVSPSQLWTAAIGSAALLAVIAWRSGRLIGLSFYAVFALAITISVQLIGVYLVFTSLIVPALATTGMRGKTRLFIAYSIGICGYVSGLIFSAVFDLPSGAMIVWTLAACGLIAQALPLVRRSHRAQTEIRTRAENQA
ncbi:MAG TPA: metal ABC transporter permease [Dokdonella sp.]|uniref:metal ABC transporter permease n=1 Tax=Dokdonella sp. TaxID=2291710 RepID=UPI002D810007|nr:metal ABC transporter permease [Dokdonella sp.]HET9031756.1 metal ABC transporter permease [Dokdonella sp.]